MSRHETTDNKIDMPDIEFRCVDEGDGGTLQIFPPDAGSKTLPILVGSYKIMTCVAVYFMVDEHRFFFAHIDARTPEIWPKMMVTKAAGSEIAGQVKRRLLDFMLHDKWDIRNAAFGENLTMQCPTVHPSVIEDELYNTPGFYVVRAVKEFFLFCARLLGKEPGGKSTSLKHIVSTARVDGKHVNGNHHILIVDPSKDDPPIRLGEIRDSRRDAEDEDLGDYKPLAITIRESVFHFGVLEDNHQQLPRKYLLPKDHGHREETRELLNWARAEYKDFGSKPGSDTSRLVEFLDQIDL